MNPCHEGHGHSGILLYYDFHDDMVLPFWKETGEERPVTGIRVCGLLVPEVMLLGGSWKEISREVTPTMDRDACQRSSHNWNYAMTKNGKLSMNVLEP